MLVSQLASVVTLRFKVLCVIQRNFLIVFKQKAVLDPESR